MDSSYEILVRLVARWRTGPLTPAEALADLEVHDQFLEAWAHVVEGMAPPAGLEVGARLQQTALEGLQLLWEASAALREAILRADPEGAEAGLALAAEGQEVLNEAFLLTRESLERLEGGAEGDL